MTYRTHLALAASLSLLCSTGCINEVLDVGALPGGDGTADGSGDATDSGEDGSTDGGSDDESGSEGSDSGSSDTGEETFPECDPPLTGVATYSLPFLYEDAFLGERRIYDCVVLSAELPAISMDCTVEGGEPQVLELTLDGLDASPLTVDQTVVLDEVLDTGLPQGYIGAGQWLSLRDADSGQLLLVGIDSGELLDSSGLFSPMPWEPELSLSVDAGLCPLLADDGMLCGPNERVAVSVTTEDGSASVLAGGQLDALGWQIHVAEAREVTEPCLDAEHGDFDVLLVRTP